MTRLSRTLICAAALCALSTLALAHGDDEAMDTSGMGMDMGMSGSNAAAAPSSVPTMTADIAQELSYFSYPDEKVWIWAHIAAMTTAWGFIAPIGTKDISTEFGGDSSDFHSCVLIHCEVAVRLAVANHFRLAQRRRCPSKHNIRF
jgi:hypothetical protein